MLPIMKIISLKMIKMGTQKMMILIKLQRRPTDCLGGDPRASCSQNDPGSVQQSQSNLHNDRVCTYFSRPLPTL